MPPNRKSRVILEEIPAIDVSQLKLEELPGQTTTSRKPGYEASSWNYWDWPSKDDQLMDKILKDEAARLVLSVERVEENILKESERLSLKATANSAENDEYWTMIYKVEEEDESDLSNPLPNENDATLDSYWNWPSVETKTEESMIQFVLNEERARRLTSIEFYETRLIRTGKLSFTTAMVNSDHDLYWAY